MDILAVDSADELAGVLAAVGLAQNYAGLRALVSEGIQTGHMTLHAKNIAIQAGASGELIDKIAEQLVEEDAIRQDRAEELLEQYS
jgi:hydroxymethylglutaryl-CoA reductase